jgi:nitrogen regulatory protein P-II 1
VEERTHAFTVIFKKETYKMKKITVIVQPVKFEAIKRRLMDMGINGITITNVEGYGFQKRKNDVLEGQDVTVEFLPKVKIEIVLKDADVEKTLGEIIEIARTGRIGDGKIFISDITDVIRIRTGERGEYAV